MELSRRNSEISASLTLAISARAREMKAAGEDVISFGAGEPDFPTPEFIVEAAREALDRGFTRYTPATGIKDLKEAVAEKLLRDNDLKYQAGQILISNGAKHSLFNTLQAILNPGDEVLIPAPYWLSYPELVKMGGGRPVFVGTTAANDFKMEPAELERAVTAKTRALILNSPSNPCGAVYQRDELEDIARIALDRGFLVIADEIYEKIIYDGYEHISIASLGEEIKEQTIVINGMSKAYAMTGWRIGFAAAREEIIKVMGNIQSHATSNPNSIAQYASVEGLRNHRGTEIIEKMVAEFNRRRLYMVDKVNSIPGLSCRKPSGAFYIMISIGEIVKGRYQGKKLNNSLEFSKTLLEEERVAVIPGIAFGADDFIRLSYATDLESIQSGLQRIESFAGRFER